MSTEEQASRQVLENEFFVRAKSLSKHSEVYRSSLVTQLLIEALAFGLCLEDRVFEAAYGNPAGRDYWRTQLSEPLLVYKFAKVLVDHIAKGAAELDDATTSTIRTFRDAAEAGEDWFIGDVGSLVVLENTPSSFESLGRIKVYSRSAVTWLLSKPKCKNLVPESLQTFCNLTRLPAEGGILLKNR